jgi:glycosyltransferase involved in cell wall biosynthesis
VRRRYPPPFSFFEHYTFRHAAYGIVASAEAAAIVRDHGFGGPLAQIPQTGIDPELFAPNSPPSGPFTIGFLGRLVPEKGVIDLLEAVAGLPQARLLLVGDGPLRPQIEARARTADLAGRVELRPAVPTTQVPAVLATINVLVLPSRTTANWKEQFGRVLVEAMACAVPVVGSSSGEIPTVLGDAGVLFPEGDVAALRAALCQLRDDGALRQDLGAKGRQRALHHYTQAALAREYAAVYRAMAAGK